jgi:hypothetical protein
MAVSGQEDRRGGRAGVPLWHRDDPWYVGAVVVRARIGLQREGGTREDRN